MDNKNIVIPDFVKEAMTEEKKYGTSVFDYVPDKDKEIEENDFFKESEIDKEEIEKARGELKTGYVGEKIKENITVDALSGIKSSVPVDSSYTSAYNDINKTIEASNIKGNRITKYGKELLTSLIGEEPNDDEMKLMASKFEEYSIEIKEYTFNHFNIDKLEEFISDRIKKSLRNICDPDEPSQYRDILARLLSQIYNAYNNVIEYRDDISELNNLAKQIDDSGILDDVQDVDKLTNEMAHKSLDELQDKMNRFMNSLKKLDDRNKRLKQDFTINDIDILLYEDIKKCLDSALSFEKIKEKVDTIPGKFNKDLKNRNNTNSIIENWIHDIRNDSKTLYTFPCNDFLSDSESREELVKFFYNSYLVDIGYSYDIPVEKDLEEYILETNLLCKHEIDALKEKAYYMLYVLARTFKYNKLESNENMIRILSYTLDIISKLGVKSHRDKFIDISNYVYDKINCNI